jgi:hypothetical protein
VTAPSLDSPFTVTALHASFGPIDKLPEVLPLPSHRTHGSNICETVCVIDQMAMPAAGTETTAARTITMRETRSI